MALDVVDIALDELEPAPWNANRLTPAMRRKVKRSLDRYGLVENLVVRRKDSAEALRYEVLSGNHRLELLRELELATAPCVVVDLDDARARLLAQALNRRGVDEPELYRKLVDEMLVELDVGDLTALLDETPRSLDRVRAGLPRAKPLDPFQAKKAAGIYGGFLGGIESGKLGYRLLAIDQCEHRRSALELFAGAGGLSWWYRRQFERVVTVDADPAHDVEHTSSAVDYLRANLLTDGPFDFVDLDDEGCPWLELDTLFELLAGADWPPFVLAVTDGYGLGARIRGAVDLERQYRWPSSRKRADGNVYDLLPELVDHGVRARADEAGCRAERIAVAWRRSRRAVYGAWKVSS